MTAVSPALGLDAEATARRAVAWAAAAGPDPARPDSGAGPPPYGPLRAAGSLARPTPESVSALGELVRDTAARLGAGRPPFADHGGAGPGALFLAAAAGGRKEPLTATRLTELIDVPELVGSAPAEGAWLDAFARHAVVGPWLGVPDSPTEALLLASPLTEVLYRPAAARGKTGTARQVALAVGMLARPRGTEVLRAAAAGWSADPAVLAWRTGLLRRLVQDGPAERRFVADVYVTARLWHGAEWDRRVRWAGRALTDPKTISDLAIRTLEYWAPLAVLERGGSLLVRERRPLRAAEAVLALVRRHRLA
ncbi:hypothetical protein ABH926_002102 [Catenulispora sp. GP43]|uniref:hypothetical protein n=1 Tax=Catenulispora sp. GP43 TaxID=3156263 RepID=UPI00351115BD